MKNYEFDKYQCTAATLRETLSKYGVAIVPEVLNQQECQQMVSGQWDFFEHITKNWTTPITRDNEEIYKLRPSHSMLWQWYDVGHVKVSWDLRQNPKIVEVFKGFWNCE